MTALNRDMVHYVKFDIRSWQGPQERIKISQSMKVIGVEQQQYFTWHMTKQRREWINGVRGHEDESWEGWQIALDTWSDLREKHGRGVDIWIGKPLFTKKFKRGEIQPSERLPESVGLLSLVKENQELSFTVLQQEWCDRFVFVDSTHPVYNKTVSWRNPLTTVISGTRRGAWQ